MTPQAGCSEKRRKPRLVDGDRTAQANPVMTLNGRSGLEIHDRQIAAPTDVGDDLSPGGSNDQRTFLATYHQVKAAGLTIC